MTIRFACEADIPQMLELLRQVELVHHGIRPDLFRNGGEKYDEAALKDILQNTPFTLSGSVCIDRQEVTRLETFGIHGSPIYTDVSEIQKK